MAVICQPSVPWASKCTTANDSTPPSPTGIASTTRSNGVSAWLVSATSVSATDASSTTVLTVNGMSLQKNDLCWLEAATSCSALGPGNTKPASGIAVSLTGGTGFARTATIAGNKFTAANTGSYIVCHASANPNINTAGSETRSSLSADGTRLYFGRKVDAADPGDVFVATRALIAAPAALTPTPALSMPLLALLAALVLACAWFVGLRLGGFGNKQD